jgi:hypothetical protein
MTAISEAVVRWLDVDVSETPPCEGVLLQFGRVCGTPSAVRVYVMCFCGGSCTIFLCERDYRQLTLGFARCGRCHLKIDKWTEI